MAALTFHWRLLQGGEQTAVTRAQQLQTAALPDLPGQLEFCRQAEACGIDSLLVDLHFSKPEPIVLATALGSATQKINFMLAVRSGLLSPTLFVQQINTASMLTNGRVRLNIVAGHSPAEQQAYGDWLSHDERYARTDEFLAIAHAFWEQRGPVQFEGRYFKIEEGRLNTPFVSADRHFPELFIAGSSPAARNLAIRHGSCWLRLGDSPDALKPSIGPVLDAGKEVGLRLSVIVKPTRQAAWRAASELIAEHRTQPRDTAVENQFVGQSDSVSMRQTYALAETEWLTPTLWTGAVRTHGASALALVGAPEDIAESILAFKAIGVSHFILSGWPKRDAMIDFGRDVLPLIRQHEQTTSPRNYAA